MDEISILHLNNFPFFHNSPEFHNSIFNTLTYLRITPKTLSAKPPIPIMKLQEPINTRGALPKVFSMDLATALTFPLEIGFNLNIKKRNFYIEISHMCK